MKKLATMLVLALVSTGLFACGEADNSTTTATTNFPLSDDTAGDSDVRYVADPNGGLAYNVTEASASAGKATIELVNSQSVTHDLAIEDSNGKTIGKTERISEGITSTAVVLKPGEYVVYCSVPGHRKAGMKGHLTVWGG
jgi:plastocyanin